MTTGHSKEAGSLQKARRERQRTLFGAKYPEYCRPLPDSLSIVSLFVTKDTKGTPTERTVKAKAFHDEIMSLPDDALNARWVAHYETVASQREAAHPFNGPAAHASAKDFDYYSKAAYWTLDEGVALLLARRPKSLNGQRVDKFKDNSSKIGIAFVEIRELADRAARAGQLGTTNSPGFFLAWAERNRFAVPDGLQAAVQNHGVQVGDWKTICDQQSNLIGVLEGNLELLKMRIAALENAPVETSLDERERTSLLKLVIGMAVKGYGHDPVASRTSTAREIASDLQLIGLSLAEDTIRKYLHEGREMLPE